MSTQNRHGFFLLFGSVILSSMTFNGFMASPINFNLTASSDVIQSNDGSLTSNGQACQVPQVENGILQMVIEQSATLVPLTFPDNNNNDNSRQGLTLPVSTVITLTCNRGFAISGGVKRSTCTASSLLFSPKLGRCVRVAQRTTKKSESSTTTPTTSNNASDKGRDLPRSSNVGCQVPEVENGYFVKADNGANGDGASLPAKSTLQPGSQIKVSCSKGYVAFGSGTVTCSQDGTWSSLDSKCLVDCGPISIANGKLSPGNTTLGSWRPFTCDIGYQLENATRGFVVCQMDTTWSQSGSCALVKSNFVPTPSIPTIESSTTPTTQTTTSQTPTPPTVVARADDSGLSPGDIGAIVGATVAIIIIVAFVILAWQCGWLTCCP